MTAENDPTAPTPENQSAAPPAPSESAPASINIQAVPPSPVTSTVVQDGPAPKPRREPLTAEQLLAHARRLDGLLALVVVVLTFFLASFLARNGDYWLHLATGKQIASGRYTFGADPFAYTSEGTPWINSTWLADWAVYQLSGSPADGKLPAGHGAVVVAVKAVLLALLAVTMLLIRRPGASLWIPAVCVGLAVTAMSPRFLLQPSCISFFLLGLTLYLLQRPPSQGPDGRLRFRARWLVPILFALWVNLDSWWLLGPLTVGLYLLGEVLQRSLAAGPDQAEAPPPGSLGSLAGVFLVGLAACLLNPHFFLVNPLHLDASAVLPPELWGAVSDSPLKGDSWFQHFFDSPLTGEYLDNVDYQNVAGLAYYPLVVLGLVSFVLELVSFLGGGGGWRWWRALVWLTFCLLSLYLVRAIPFFAVVAGPITALNFQDFLARRLGTAPRLEPAWKVWSLGGRIVTLVAGLALLVAAWPGWLGPQPNNPRRSRHVGWAVVADPSLHQAALKLSDLRRQGVLPEDAHGFNSNPEIANYCAWFCPEEKGFIDYRLGLFPETAASSYLEVRQALLRPPAQGRGLDVDAGAAAFDWQRVLRDRHINHVILSDPDTEAQLNAFGRLWFDQEQWTLLYADGRTTIFGWDDPERPARESPFRGHSLDLDQLAFGPHAVRGPVGVQEPPQVPEAWYEKALLDLDRYWKGPGSRPLAVDQASMCRLYFQGVDMRMESLYPRLRPLADALAVTSVPPSPGAPWVQVPVTAYLLRRIGDQDRLAGEAVGPPAAPLLAIRYARQAIAENPDYAAGYVQLAQAYLYLSNYVEARWSPQAVQLHEIRRLQAIAALRNALTLDPKLYKERNLLAQLYQQLGYLDLVVKEMQLVLEDVRAAGPQSREDEKDFAKRIDNLEHGIENLDKEVENRRRDYELRAKNRDVRRQVDLAMKRGLAQQALDVLLEAEPPLDADLVQQKFKLLLSTGRLTEASEPELRQTDFDNVLLDAALGAYDLADKPLERMIAHLRWASTEQFLGLDRAVTLQNGMELRRLAGITLNVGGLVGKQADMMVYRGLMALEQGDTAAATRYLQEVVDLAGSGSGAGGKAAGDSRSDLNFVSRSVAVHYLELMRAAGN